VLGVGGDVSGCDEADDDTSSFPEESVAADAAVELESDRSFLLLVLDAVMVYYFISGRRGNKHCCLNTTRRYVGGWMMCGDNNSMFCSMFSQPREVGGDASGKIKKGKRE